MSLRRTVCLCVIVLCHAGIAIAGSFTPGNIVVVRLNSSSSTATAAFLDEYTTAGSLVQSIALPTAAAGSNRTLTLSGTASSEGMLTRSYDEHYLLFVRDD
jgi:hypothetical protein